VGKPERNRPLGRPRRMWVDNIKMDLLEIDSRGVDWTGLACECGYEPSGSIMLGNYQVATQLVASRVVLSSIEIVII
jgi:hypothetical protein